MTDPETKERPCQWCGEPYRSAHHSKLYCSDRCKNDMGNFLAVVGKRIAADAMLWRRRRGKAGAAAEAFKRMGVLLDQANEEFRTSRAANAPDIDSYVAARNAAPGVRHGIDR